MYADSFGLKKGPKNLGNFQKIWRKGLLASILTLIKYIPRCTKTLINKYFPGVFFEAANVSVNILTYYQRF